MLSVGTTGVKMRANVQDGLKKKKKTETTFDHEKTYSSLTYLWKET